MQKLWKLISVDETLRELKRNDSVLSQFNQREVLTNEKKENHQIFVFAANDYLLRILNLF